MVPDVTWANSDAAHKQTAMILPRNNKHVLLPSKMLFIKLPLILQGIDNHEKQTPLPVQNTALQYLPRAKHT
jgi:hypothetical protein